MKQWNGAIPLSSYPNLTTKDRLCLDLARLNQVLMTPMYRGPTLNDIFLKLNDANYLSLIDASSDYHNLKLDDRSSYLTTLTCQICRYRYKKLLSGAAPAGDMFQWQIHEIFKGLPNEFGIADDILVIGYDSDDKEHNEKLW